MRAHISRQQTWLALLVGLTGVLTAIALPFAPVVAETTTLTWPVPGQPVESSTALVSPYRPSELAVSIPCSALRAATSQPSPVTVLATGADGAGMTVTGSAGEAILRFDDVEAGLVVPAEPADCRITVDSIPGGMNVVGADGQTTEFADQPVPEVFGFRTDLVPPEADGLSVTAEITGPFATTPTVLKTALIVVQVLAVVGAFVLLRRG
ncbi:MAG: hypothetical protein U1D00_14350, partial [Mycobacterium sp.]|nr:hypothetical protein [Mycobacterium sp.]